MKEEKRKSKQYQGGFEGKMRESVRMLFGSNAIYWILIAFKQQGGRTPPPPNMHWDLNLFLCCGTIWVLWY